LHFLELEGEVAAMTHDARREGLTAAIGDLFGYLNRSRASRPTREELLKAIKELARAQHGRPIRLVARPLQAVR
jgi:hypothetical protein